MPQAKAPVYRIFSGMMPQLSPREQELFRKGTIAWITAFQENDRIRWSPSNTHPQGSIEPRIGLVFMKQGLAHGLTGGERNPLFDAIWNGPTEKSADNPIVAAMHWLYTQRTEPKPAARIAATELISRDQASVMEYVVREVVLSEAFNQKFHGQQREAAKILGFPIETEVKKKALEDLGF